MNETHKTFYPHDFQDLLGLQKFNGFSQLIRVGWVELSQLFELQIVSQIA